MHPFIGQLAGRAGWPFSNFPPRRRHDVQPAEYWIPRLPFASPLEHVEYVFPLPSRFLNQTEITRAGLSPDTRIREFEKKFKSECTKSNHVRSPSVSPFAPRAVSETKCRPIVGTARESGSRRVIAFKTWNQLREDSDWY